MAELRKITKAAPLSNFSQVGPQGGSAFLAFADMAQRGYEFLKPISDAAEGEWGAELARRQIGQNGYPIVSKAQPTTSGGGNLSGFSPDDDDAFIASLSGTESSGRWDALNNEVGAGGKRGHGGRLQFGDARLSEAAAAGVLRPMTAKEFAQQPPSVQRAVETWHFGDIDRKAQDAGLGYYIGKQVAGVTITQNAIRAMAHLGGFNGAKRFLESGGEYNPSDSFGTSLRDYALKHGGIQTAQAAGVDPDTGMALVQDSAVEALAPQVPPTLVRTSEGKIEPRMHSPLSEGIMLATSAAANTAYLSEMLLKGSTDMMSLSENFIGNPDGFQQAAQSYIDGVVESAPALMKADLRQKMGLEASRRYMGIMEEHQRDIRQRANNSSRALVERYANDYAEALAAGNFDEAAAARGSLEEVLTVRESLPGAAWPREQSQNVILGAQDTAVRIAEQNRAKMKSEQAGTLRTIIKAAENGQTAADEAILDDPSVLAANPELALEAAAKVGLRDMMPGFFALPPAEMDAMIAEQRALPVEQGWQIDIPNAMQTARNAAVAAIDKDPIAYAQERLPQKPPALDDFSPDAPERFISSMEARRDYANGMVEAGYIDKPAFLSKTEIESLSGAMSKSSPPEIRAALAGAIVSGFGPDAAQVFKVLNVDAVTSWGGALMAKGGSGALAAEAIRGQAIIDENQAQLPPEAEWRTTIQTNFRAAMAGLPLDTVQAEADILKFAKAIYANRAAAPGFEADTSTMTEAIQTALGQVVNPKGETTGGVQDFFGHRVLMPVGVSAERVTKSLAEGIGHWSVMGMIRDRDQVAAFWDKVGGGQPLIGGEPLDPSMIEDGEVRFVPVSGTRYRMEVPRSNSVADVHTPEGNIYIVDFARLP